MTDTEKLRVRIVDKEFTDADLAFFIFNMYQEERNLSAARLQMIIKDLSPEQIQNMVDSVAADSFHQSVLVRMINKVNEDDDGNTDTFDIDVLKGEGNIEDVTLRFQKLIVGGLIEIISNID